MIVKASAGGGGRGMRIVRSEEELPALFKAAQGEAAAAFGNGDLYMEKFIERPRHIEFQMLADQYGNVVSLGERECSIQRRHQKLLEESPSTQVTPELRDADRRDAVARRCREIGYVNAGTIEFLMDEDRQALLHRDEHAHPGGASGHGDGHRRRPGEEPDSAGRGRAAGDVLHGPIVHRGHAIECRINAEHPEKFTPSAGKITTFNPPGGTGVRIDTAAYAEGVIPPYYDSLIAKLIVRGKDRDRSHFAHVARAGDVHRAKASTPRFHCTARFLPTPISAPARSTRRSWSACSATRKSQKSVSA